MGAPLNAHSATASLARAAPTGGRCARPASSPFCMTCTSSAADISAKSPVPSLVSPCASAPPPYSRPPPSFNRRLRWLPALPCVVSGDGSSIDRRLRMRSPPVTPAALLAILVPLRATARYSATIGSCIEIDIFLQNTDILYSLTISRVLAPASVAPHLVPRPAPRPSMCYEPCAKKERALRCMPVSQLGEMPSHAHPLYDARPHP